MNSKNSLLENVFNVLREGVIVVQEDGEILWPTRELLPFLGLENLGAPATAQGACPLVILCSW